MYTYVHVHMPVSQPGEAGTRIYRIERERKRGKRARHEKIKSK